MSTVEKSSIDWLFPEVRKRVLSLLLAAPDERWYLRDIARRTDCALGTIRRELAGLTAAEILRRTKDGNRTYYQANPSCPLLPEITGLIRKTAGLADVIRGVLSPLAELVDLAFIYGSQATGKATAESDVDLLVVGNLDEIDLHRAAGDAEKQLNRPVNYMLLDREEFVRRQKETGSFLARVLEGKKIVIMGDINEI